MIEKKKKKKFGPAGYIFPPFCIDKSTKSCRQEREDFGPKNIPLTLPNKEKNAHPEKNRGER